jgi:hypothetical protein
MDRGYAWCTGLYSRCSWPRHHAIHRHHAKGAQYLADVITHSWSVDKAYIEVIGCPCRQRRRAPLLERCPQLIPPQPSPSPEHPSTACGITARCCAKRTFHSESTSRSRRLPQFCGDSAAHNVEPHVTRAASSPLMMRSATLLPPASSAVCLAHLKTPLRRVTCLRRSRLALPRA